MWKRHKNSIFSHTFRNYRLIIIIIIIIIIIFF